MVNLLGAAHAAHLKNRRDADPNLMIFAAGDHRLTPISQGDMQLILTNNSAPTRPLPRLSRRMVQSLSVIMGGVRVAR